MARSEKSSVPPLSSSPEWGFHYAWVIVGVTFLVLLVAAGVRTAPAVLITPLHNEFLWSRGDISFAVAVSLIWFGLGGPVAGTLVDRFGPTRVMLGGLSLVAIGMALMLLLQNLWQLHLFWGVVVGIGTGATANVLGATIAQRWFKTHRGLVVGLLGGAAAAGQLVFLPVMMELTSATGWRGAVIAASLAVGLMLLPVLLLMRDSPGQVGLRPYGDDGSQPALGPTEPLARTTLAQAARTRDFWLLALSFFICGYTTNGLIGTHLLPHALEIGFSNVAAASVVGVMGMMNIIGTLASGWLSDRFDNRVLLATYYGLRALAIAMLPFVGDLTTFFVFAVIYGLDWIATVPPTVNLTAKRFGQASLGTIYGWIFFSHMVGAAAGAYAGGVLRDQLGNYSMAFYSAALLGFVAAAFSMAVRPVQRVRLAEG